MFGAPLDVTLGNVSRSRIARWTAFSLLALTLAWVVPAASASAQYCTPDQCDECDLCRCSQRCCHSYPDLWLVNTRCAPRCKNLDCGFEELIYKRYDRDSCRWVRESREAFLAQESSHPTMFFAHGNSLNHKNAMKQCWQVYCKMRCCEGPKRLVYWSWPAERVYKTKGLRVREMIEKNLRIKYVYSEYQGYYMAKLVNQMSLSQRVMMAGHSYGGIIASSSAHFLGGGCLRGLTLEGGAAVERPNLRVGVISGAFDHDMLEPGKRYGQTFVAAEKVYVTRNINDRTLKKWPKTSWRCCKAIGVLGVNANRIGEYRNKLCQQTMTSDVGTSHYLTPHLKSVRFVAALCCLAFPECTSCPTTPSPTTVPPMSSPVPDLAAEAEPIEIDLNFGELSEVHFDDGFNEDGFNDGFMPLEEDEFVVDEPAGFDEADLELAFGDDMGFGPIEFDEPRFTPPVSIHAFAGPAMLTPTQSQHSKQSTASPNKDSMHVDWNEPTLAMVQAMTRTQRVAEEPACELVTASYSPQEGEQSEVATTAEADEPEGNMLWYQCGLCLAIVLTGQFYFLFSKRVASS